MSQTKAQLIDGKGSAAFDGDLTVDTNTLYVDSTNNRVGLGSSAPLARLDVSGDIYGTLGLHLGNASGGSFVKSGFIENLSNTSRSLRIGADPDNVGANSVIRFDVDGSEVARFDSSGRLLVGTSSSPTGGDGQYAPIVVQGYTGLATGPGYISIQRGLAATSLSSGNDLGYVSFGDNAGNTFARILCQTDAASGSGDYPGRLVFSTTPDAGSSPVEAMRITNSRHFKATTTGGYRNASGLYHEIRQSYGNDNALWIDHTASSGGLGGISVNYTAQTPNNTGNVFIQCNDSTATRFAIRSNGGIANFSANNVNLSDRNSKKDIVPVAGTWDCLKEWEIVNFRYKDQPDDADLNMGVIAQQIAESCPEVITVFQEAKEATEDQPAQEERLGVKDQQIMWMAIKALQEAQLRIETLEAEVAALKAA